MNEAIRIARTKITEYAMRGDHEAAHSLRDEMFKAVLDRIALGGVDAEQMSAWAQFATERLPAFQEWCA